MEMERDDVFQSDQEVFIEPGQNRGERLCTFRGCSFRESQAT